MLTERHVDFAHGDRMQCAHCGASNRLTAEEYAGIADATMRCSDCPSEFLSGQQVVGLRNADDAAFDDINLPKLAWYHTTTLPDWPPVLKPLPEEEVRHYRVHLSEDEFERRCRIEENQALHLGTYEAAVESMLRRMDQKDDRGLTFYLHRVRLRRELAIEPGWRHEKTEPAARVTSTELADQRVEVIRYLNIYESTGSISLAVVREAIESTQSIRLPVPELTGQPADLTIERLQEFREKVRTIRTEHFDKALTAPDVLRQMFSEQLGERPLQEPMEAHKVLNEMAEFVADQYLIGLSPTIRDKFMVAMSRPSPQDNDEVDLSWLTRFIGYATLLTHPTEVQKFLTGQPWRAVESA